MNHNQAGLTARWLRAPPLATLFLMLPWLVAGVGRVAKGWARSQRAAFGLPILSAVAEGRAGVPMAAVSGCHPAPPRRKGAAGPLSDCSCRLGNTTDPGFLPAWQVFEPVAFADLATDRPRLVFASLASHLSVAVRTYCPVAWAVGGCRHRQSAVGGLGGYVVGTRRGSKRVGGLLAVSLVRP